MTLSGDEIHFGVQKGVISAVVTIIAWFPIVQVRIEWISGTLQQPQRELPSSLSFQGGGHGGHSTGVILPFFLISDKEQI